MFTQGVFASSGLNEAMEVQWTGVHSPQCIQPKFTSSVAYGRGDLFGPYFIEGTLTSDSYIRMLREEVFPDIRRTLGEGGGEGGADGGADGGGGGGSSRGGGGGGRPGPQEALCLIL